MIAKSLLNHHFSISRVFAFFLSIYRHGKTTELLSFIFWELKYKFGFYRNESIAFNSSVYIDLSEDTLASCSFLQKGAIDWNMIYIDQAGDIYGNTKDKLNQLFRYRDSGLVCLFTLPSEITSLFIASSGAIFVATEGKVFRFAGDTLSNTPVLEFSTAKSVFLPGAFTERSPGTLFVGEYVNLFHKKWHFAAYLYYSTDDGQTWTRTDFLKEKGTNKHIHVVKWSALMNGLVLTDGDNKKKLWFNRFTDDLARTNQDEAWLDISKRHINMGGYTAMAETDEQIVFGTDYNGGTNFLVTTPDLSTFNKRVVPDPYRRSIFTNIVITRNAGMTKMWAVLHGESGSKTRSLLMMSEDEGLTWDRVIEYNGKKFRIIILNNAKEAQDRLYISVLKLSLKNTAQSIGQAQLKTAAPTEREYESLGVYSLV